ncbi:MAG: PEGA domain-containing protein [Candidatus Marinimicrobia bacterium]|nr:PEGA domain-containing protein [Candidatus Neomarinimicrobiota bacterium]
MIKIFRYFACLMVMFCFVERVLALTTEKLNIAVIDLDTQGGLTQQEAVVLTSRLRSKIVGTNAFIMLDRGRMDEILKEQGFQLTGCTSTECAVEMGRLLNVQQILAGSVGKIGKLYTIDIILIDVETAQMIKSLTRDYTGEIEGLINLMGSIANELAGISKPVTTVPVETAPAEIGFGVVGIVTVPTQAMVYIDGIKLGLTPFKLDELKAGEHTLKVTKKGYIDHEQSFSVEVGRTKKLEVSLERLNVLVISSKPSGASFYLNDELKGLTPSSLELLSDNYKLKLIKEGYADWEKELTINRDYSTNVNMLKMYTVDFTSVPSQAEVFLNNKYIGRTPVTRRSAEGSYMVGMHLNNYTDFEQFIKLRKDMQIKAKLRYTKEYRRQLAEMKKGGRSRSRLLFFGSAAAVIGGGVYYYMTQIAPSQDKGFPKPPGRP